MHEEYGLKSNSAEMQDIAAALLLGSNKKFLDIGASSAVLGNNTYLLEKELGWDGLCFDLREEGDRVTATTFTNQGGTYEERGTKLHNVDCTTPLFLNTLKENGFCEIVDYISMDVDAASLAALSNLVEIGGCIFKFLTYEHDYHYSLNHDIALRRRTDIPQGTLNEETEVYESGSEDLWTQPFSKEGIDARKYKAKDILRNKGYLLLFEDVSFETGGGLHPMEDWWINPQYFPEWLKRIQGQGLHFSECIKRLSIISSQLHSEEVAKLIQKTCFK
tara:strand:+ start:3193 stop:4020 length:828 start_codon:yes stop_codon:yes gene_type:complete